MVDSNAAAEAWFRDPAVATVVLGPDGTVRFWDDAAEALFERTPERVYGRECETVFGVDRATFTPASPGGVKPYEVRLVLHRTAGERVDVRGIGWELHERDDEPVTIMLLAEARRVGRSRRPLVEGDQLAQLFALRLAQVDA